MTFWGVNGHDWPYALRDAGLQTLRDNVFGLAAALTYFSVITLFPALVAFVSLLVLAGRGGSVSSLLSVIGAVGPTSGAPEFSRTVHHVLSRGASWGSFAATAAFCFVAASGYVSTFGWMSRRLRGEKAGGSFWRQRLKQSLVALATLGLLGVIALALVLSPSLFAEAGSRVGTSGAAGLLVFRVLRWPLLFVAGVVLFNLLYSSSVTPPGERRGWITGGSVVAILFWLLAALLFDLYVRNVGHYAAFYGLFGYLLAFLLWLWMLNIAVLGGVELNLQLDRRRQEAAAGDAHETDADEKAA